MIKNTANQFIGANMTYAASGTPIVTSGAVIAYVRANSLAFQIGAVGAGVCVPNSFGLHHYVPAQSETNYDWIAFTFVASGGVNQTVQLYTEFPQTGDSFARIGAPVGASLAADVGSIQVGVNSLYARVGAPVGASIAVDVGSIQVQANSIYGRLGASVGATHAVDIASIQTGVTNLALTRASSGQVDDIYTRIGAAGSALTVLANSANLDNVFTRIGAAGAGLTVLANSANLDNIYTRIGAAGAGLTVLAASGDLAITNAAVSSLHTRVSSVDVRVSSSSTQVDSLYARVGAGGIGLTTLPTSAHVADVYARIGAPVGASIAVDLSSAAVQVGSNATQLGSLYARVGAGGVGLTTLSNSTDVAAIYSRLGAPTGASVSVDIGSAQTGINSIYGRIGAAGINLTSISVSAATDLTSALVATSSLDVRVQSLTTALSSVDTRVGSAATQVGSVYTAVAGRLPTALTAGGNIKADALLLNGAVPNNLAATQVVSGGALLVDAGVVRANVTHVNSIAVDGSGTLLDPWGPV